MPFWTLFGLQRGAATTDWPAAGGEDGQTGVLGMPRLDPGACPAGCEACVEACLPGAIQARPEGGLAVDYGRCIACQLCVERCPEGAMAASGDWAFGVRDRRDLVWAGAAAGDGASSGAAAAPEAERLRRRIAARFRRSLHIRHLDAGSCNGCEAELQALNNPFYNLHRLGIFFVASPRFADLLLVTGPVTAAMRPALLRAYEAMPEPRWVMAAGTCAVSGGVAGGGVCGNGVEGVLPVDLYLPGCPPNPAAFIAALLALLERRPQAARGGRYGE